MRCFISSLSYRELIPSCTLKLLKQHLLNVAKVTGETFNTQSLNALITDLPLTLENVLTYVILYVQKQLGELGNLLKIMKAIILIETTRRNLATLVLSATEENSVAREGTRLVGRADRITPSYAANYFIKLPNFNGIRK